MRRRLNTFFNTAAAVAALSLFAAVSASAYAPHMTAVWVDAGRQDDVSEVKITLPLADTYSADEVIAVPASIYSYGFIGKAEVFLNIYNEQQEKIINGSQLMDLISGENPCHFSFDAGSLGTGSYTLELDVEFQQRVSDARFITPFKKVDSEELTASMDSYRNRLNSVTAQQQIQKASAGSSYLKARLMLGQEVLERAQQDAEQGKWRELDRKLEYIGYVVNSAYAGLAMGNIFPEQVGSQPVIDFANLKLEQGSFSVDGEPVYPFGANLDEPTPQKLERMSLFGLQFAVITIDIYKANDIASIKEKYDPVFEAAKQFNIALTVRLQEDRPENVKASRDVYVNNLRRILPYLENKPMLFAVNIVHNPKFNFRGDSVRSEFISLIKKRYPDRIDLNRAWRSHLASYNDILVWDYPEHGYQNRRAFQFDWQQFHQNLGTRYFNWAFEQIRDIAPDLPLTVSLPNTAFTQGESRYGVDREALAEIGNISGCTSDTSPIDKFYSIAYPNQSAYFTLLHSIEPSKPVVNFNNSIEVLDNMDPVWVRSYVHTSLWESVMSGLSATAFSYDSTLFDHPNAIDALTTSILDINRLASLIHEFQEAPSEIAVLYSKSSKIFDDGTPHLESVFNAYEGTSFSGFNTRFITESQIAEGALQDIKVLVLPETPAVADETFNSINEYALADGNLVRVGTPIPYNEHGFSRRGTIKHTPNTILVRGLNMPTEYLHAMDAMIEVGELPAITRAINDFGYPVEGVKTRFVSVDGKDYLYLVSLRRDPVHVDLYGHKFSGRDLIRGRDLYFPRMIRPLDPMLIRLDDVKSDMALTASASE